MAHLDHGGRLKAEGLVVGVFSEYGAWMEGGRKDRGFRYPCG